MLQLVTPYVFVSDDPLYVNQFPPFLHYETQSRPGVMLCGRFPADIWPRPHMWAFEWHDLEKDLCEITGMSRYTLQPAAGSHGELTGVMIMKKYFRVKDG